MPRPNLSIFSQGKITKIQSSDCSISFIFRDKYEHVIKITYHLELFAAAVLCPRQEKSFTATWYLFKIHNDIFLFNCALKNKKKRVSFFVPGNLQRVWLLRLINHKLIWLHPIWTLNLRVLQPHDICSKFTTTYFYLIVHLKIKKNECLFLYPVICSGSGCCGSSIISSSDSILYEH